MSINHINVRIKYLIMIVICRPSSMTETRGNINGDTRCPFYKLSDALDCASKTPGSMVFAFEINSQRKRRYLVTELSKFWPNYYLNTSKKYYEVIPANQPCKMYFDLEFMMPENIGKNGDEMTISLIDATNALLKKMFQHDSSRDDVLILDSSTDTKFSQHLIFTKTIFENNKACGHFVNFLQQQLLEEERSMMQVKNKDCEGEVSFVDSKVYNSNQNFRIFLSSKFGKSNPLVVAKIDTSCIHLSNLDSSDKCLKIFLMSLISNVPAEFKTIEMKDVLKPTEISENLQQGNNNGGTFYTLSPYPEIENVTSNLVLPGYIESWRPLKIFNGDFSVILYNIEGSRFCRNVGRHHSRNRIYYLFNLLSLTLVQACNSCLGYRSPPIQVIL